MQESLAVRTPSVNPAIVREENASEERKPQVHHALKAPIAHQDPALTENVIQQARKPAALPAPAGRSASREPAQTINAQEAPQPQEEPVTKTKIVHPTNALIISVLLLHLPPHHPHHPLLHLHPQAVHQHLHQEVLLPLQAQALLHLQVPAEEVQFQLA